MKDVGPSQEETEENPPSEEGNESQLPQAVPTVAAPGPQDTATASTPAPQQQAADRPSNIRPPLRRGSLPRVESPVDLPKGVDLVMQVIQDRE